MCAPACAALCHTNPQRHTAGCLSFSCLTSHLEPPQCHAERTCPPGSSQKYSGCQSASSQAGLCHPVVQQQQWCNNRWCKLQQTKNLARLLPCALERCMPAHLLLHHLHTPQPCTLLPPSLHTPTRPWPHALTPTPPTPTPTQSVLSSPHTPLHHPHPHTCPLFSPHTPTPPTHTPIAPPQKTHQNNSPGRSTRTCRTRSWQRWRAC